MPLSSCDDDRLTLAQTARAKLTEARELAESGDYAGALECYLFAFDNSLAVSSWGGVRLSYIPAEIAQLGAKYPQATTALIVRRDAREELIRAGATDYDLVAEWASINCYLHDQARELLLLQELQDKGILQNSIKEKIIKENFDRLLAERNYRLLADYLNVFGRMFLNTIRHYELACLFPERHGGGSKRQILTEGSKVLELALGIGKRKQASGIIERILAHCNDAESYKVLIGVAQRAGNERIAHQLTKRAAKTDFSVTKQENLSLSGTEDGAETSFTKILFRALKQTSAGNDKYEPALAFLAKQAGFQGCLIVGADKSVLTSKGLTAENAVVIASEVVNILQTAQISVSKMDPARLQGMILRSAAGYFVVFDFGHVILVLMSSGLMDQFL